MARPKRICSIPDCGKPHYGNGYCSAHRDKWLRYGDPLAGRVEAAPREFLQKALRYSGDECLFWPYSGNGKGYGRVYWQGKRQYVHRIVCECAHGPAPTDKHQAAHRCGNGDSGCCNPRHLSWKTRAENEADKLRHGTHQLGENNRQAKLTEEDVRQIRKLRAALSSAAIAEKFNVHEMHIARILRGDRWGWLK